MGLRNALRRAATAVAAEATAIAAEATAIARTGEPRGGVRAGTALLALRSGRVAPSGIVARAGAYRSYSGSFAASADCEYPQRVR